LLKEKLPKSWIAIVIILSTLFAGIYMIFSASKSNLPSYVDLPPPPVETTITPPPETFEHIDNEYRLSIMVPDGWQKIIKDGFNTYTHRDGSMLQIQTLDYIPSLNMVGEETAANDVAAIGGNLGGFSRLSADSYVIAYESDGAAYLELSVWDRITSIRVRFVVPAEMYEKYYDTMIYCLDSFYWEKEDPIPDGFMLYYNEFGDCEFGLPLNWSGAVTADGVYAATNPEVGSVMYIAVTDSPYTFHDVSQVQYAEVMGENRQNFILRSYANDGTNISAEAVYNVGNTEYALIQYRTSTGAFQYSFSFECPMDYINQELPTFQTAVGLFRYWN
jgi:hypothetical protein